MPDTLQGGRFVIVGSLGEGAQGRTFDGFDEREGREVAIKRFDVRGAKSWKDAELAEREARVLQGLSHPKLPRYVDHFEHDGALYLVMEKIQGESLASLKKRGGLLSEPDVVRLLRDASEVLDYLQSRAPPVIHRDLKPGNVIRRPDGSFAFVDFGAVRAKLRSEGGSTIVGTFGYMAPEQFQGRALPASDVYAVGATALSLLTGQEPENLPHRGLAIDVRAALQGRASRPLVGALEQMLDPDPDRRAARIAPVLARLEERGGTSQSHHGRHESRRERRARRHARRQARRAAHGAVPLPFVWMLTLVITAAIVAFSLATHEFVPVVLWLLLLLFSQRWIRGGGRGAQAPSADDAAGAEGTDEAPQRVAEGASRTRVSVDEPEEDLDEDSQRRERTSPPPAL
jgi:hypothetical protein